MTCKASKGLIMRPGSMAVCTYHIALPNLYHDVLYASSGDLRQVEFLTAPHVVKLHDPIWVAFSTVHTGTVLGIQDKSAPIERLKLMLTGNTQPVTTSFHFMAHRAGIGGPGAHTL